MKRLILPCLVAACAAPHHPFPLRDPYVLDRDLTPVSLPCRPDPSDKEPNRQACAPKEYESPFIWDQLDNLAFARISRGLSVEVHGESANVNSLDEVADSSWFTNLPRGSASVKDVTDDGAPGACKPDDLLEAPDKVADGTWKIDRGKDNGSTLGFRIDVPGRGKYMLKADDEGVPEQATAASVIGAAVFEALGFNTTCEQIITLRKSQLALEPGLTVTTNKGSVFPFDDKALDAVLKSTTQMPGGFVRMHASKWLSGYTLGPFRYVGTRADDPHDVVDHADRRELRGSRILAAWIDHWDAREQNTMDVWVSEDETNPRSSPGHVAHYFIDTSDTLGQVINGPRDFQVRLGRSYEFDMADIGRAFITFGAETRPWDRAQLVPGREKFGFYTARDFNPEKYKPFYPNPAFLRTTERDAAWMARLIARFSEADIRRLVAFGKFSDPGDVEYLVSVMLARQRAILARYLGKLSPLGEVHAMGPERICVTDFARLRELAPAAQFQYAVTQRGGGRSVSLPSDVGADGSLCFRTQSLVTGTHPDGDPAQRTTIVITNGSKAGPLEIHTFDLGSRGMRVVGVTRPAP